MKREQFMDELYEKLRVLPNDEREKALNYYEEYFDDAGIENEQSVLKDLGDVSKIAEEIINNSVSSPEAKSANSYEYNKNAHSNNYYENKKYNENKSYGKNDEYRENNRNYDDERKRRKNPMWIVFTIIGLIVAGPLLIGFFGMFFGFLGIMIGLIAAAFGIAISGIVSLFSLPFVGVAAVGVIIFNLGKGILSLVLLVIIAVFIIKGVKMSYNYLRSL